MYVTSIQFYKKNWIIFLSDLRTIQVRVHDNIYFFSIYGYSTYSLQNKNNIYGLSWQTFICRIKSSTGRLVISAGENFTKSSLNTAELYNLRETIYVAVLGKINSLTYAYIHKTNFFFTIMNSLTWYHIHTSDVF